MQCLRNDSLTHFGAIGISRVDEVDSELDRPPEYSNRLTPVLRLFPDPLAGYSHRPKAKPMDAKVTAEQEFSGVIRRQVIGGTVDRY